MFAEFSSTVCFLCQLVSASSPSSGRIRTACSPVHNISVTNSFSDAYRPDRHCHPRSFRQFCLMVAGVGMFDPGSSVCASFFVFVEYNHPALLPLSPLPTEPIPPPTLKTSWQPKVKSKACGKTPDLSYSSFFTRITVISPGRMPSWFSSSFHTFRTLASTFPGV